MSRRHYRRLGPVKVRNAAYYHDLIRREIKAAAAGRAAIGSHPHWHVMGRAPSRMDDATSLGEMSLLQIDAFPGPLQMGHEHCKIRAKVRALDMAMSQMPVAVCEECESKEYALHPTHIAGGIVYGHCNLS